MNERITTDAGRTTLRMERRLAHPPAKVWRALTDPAEVRQWFPTEMNISGDVVGYGFGPDGKVVELDEPHVFAHTWGEDVLRWEIRPDGDGSLLIFTHTFTDHYGAASFAAGWHSCIAAMAVRLDGRAPEARGDMAPLHEHYIAILGLISGTLADGALRLERQLPRHASQVWQALSGPAISLGAPPPAGFTILGVTAPVSRVEEAKLVEFGPVRFELAQGTGQGARLIITHTGAAPDLLPAWRSHAEALSARLAALPPA
ncbi:SRPBCC family protein [Nonomuraea sediminis]|uniref:SRPBCC family protein n=1 Tax=Nonomuraea sediminis TaxID=2835864 RepID=UPI001BDC3BDD|nr:SRPBCC family protein [Nonomuraea sediminis]